MSEKFSELFEISIAKNKFYPGAIIRSQVINIEPDYVIVQADLKSEGSIPVEQFKDDQGELEVGIGDEVEVAIEALENGWGETRLSRERAKRQEVWNQLARAHEFSEPILGIISSRVKGGFTVEFQGVHAFLPGSLVDIRPVRDPIELEGRELEFKVIKLDKKRNNVVVSRRSVVESENSAEREALLISLQEGQIVKGIVKNLTDYGAFVDLGGVDGLLHITDMAWKRVKHPNEIVNIGDELSLKILKFDRDKTRVSLGLKQLGADPWIDIASRYPGKTKLKGLVTNITDYGCFVEIEEGVEGLVHVSEMDWTNKNIHPSKVVQLGTEVEVQVLDIDSERRRISLGLKQCQINPWEAFAQTHRKGERVKGAIKSITDFGIFIGLEGNIDGLVHLSDVSWQEDYEQVLRQYKKNDKVEAMILAIDAERERISLGIKQLDSDPFSAYFAKHEKGSVVIGRVIEVGTKFATLQLTEEVQGYLRATEVSRDRIDDLSSQIHENDELEAKIIGFDRKLRRVILSIKAKDVQEEKEALKMLRSNSDEVTKTLGDLFKGKISGPNSS